MKLVYQTNKNIKYKKNYKPGKQFLPHVGMKLHQWNLITWWTFSTRKIL